MDGGPRGGSPVGDNGADVVHVDPPGGWKWSAEADAVLNHGKTRVVLDFENAGDLAEVRRLVSRSDVVIENFRPGALSRSLWTMPACGQRIRGPSTSHCRGSPPPTRSMRRWRRTRE